MQPPPRKVKPSVALKNIHADQVAKLNSKHQQECDLLEDMRTFFSRKAALEKEYAQGLVKVTTQLLKREFPAQPDLPTEDGQERKTVVTVWRSILEESDRLAKARLQAAEIYAEKAAEPLKPAKAAKVQCFKKITPQLSAIQAEVAQCVMELVKTQKVYAAEEGVAHEARQKSSEAEDKLKRKSTGIFQSLASLQKSCAKLRTRTEASEVKETAARNEYLLSLSAANAHHIRYYSTDLPEIMKTLDCDVYDKIQESLTVAGQTAADIAQNEANFFQGVAEETTKICRDFSLQCYLFQNPVFTNLVQYQFEPAHGDTCNKVSKDHGAGPDLEKEARKWSTKVAKETRAIRDYFRQMTILQNAKVGEKASEAGSQESTTADPEVRLEELRQSLRKAETAKLKAEARLEALRLGGVNVDEWINQAQMESLVAEESGLARTPSQASLRTESSGGHSANDEHEPTYTHYDDDDDFIDDTFNTTGNRSGRVFPIYCKALYDFQASNYDEMTIKADEDLELIGDGDGEGWVKAKNSLGQEGYIPETYVDLGGLSDVPAPLEVEAMNAINDTASETATPTAPTAQPMPAAASVTSTTTPDLQSPTSGDLQQDTTSSYSSGDLEVQQATEVMPSDGSSLPVTVVTSSGEAIWARALYDYEAQTEEELSFLEGALIRIIRKDDNGVDDGFWEGECNGRCGVFPSLVVEEISGPPNDPMSPGAIPGHPGFSVPPPVHVTLPTPDAEPPPPPPMANGDDIDEPLPPPPPLTSIDLSETDSQATPTPTADQSPKKVRFSSEKQRPGQNTLQQSQQQSQGQQPQHQQQEKHQEHQHHQQQQQHQQQQHQQQRRQPTKFRITNMVNIGSKNKKSDSKRNSKSHIQSQVDVPSPILRHKSLPNSLDNQEMEVSAINSSDPQLQQLQNHNPQPDGRPPLSPPSSRRIQNQQSISRSQPQLTPILRTPPPSRRLIIQQQQQQHKQQQLQHYPSEPLSLSSEEPESPAPHNLTLNLSASYSGETLSNRSRSYPNTPLASPQTEVQPMPIHNPPSSARHSTSGYNSSPRTSHNFNQELQLLQLFQEFESCDPRHRQGQQPQQPLQRPQPLSPSSSSHSAFTLNLRTIPHQQKHHQQSPANSPKKSLTLKPQQSQQRQPQHPPAMQPSPSRPQGPPLTQPKQFQYNHPPTQPSLQHDSYPHADTVPQRRLAKQQSKSSPSPQQQRYSGQAFPSKHHGLANDKMPLCVVDNGSDWESEEGEESLV